MMVILPDPPYNEREAAMYEQLAKERIEKLRLRAAIRDGVPVAFNGGVYVEHDEDEAPYRVVRLTEGEQ